MIAIKRRASASVYVRIEFEVVAQVAVVKRYVGDRALCSYVTR